MDLSPRILGANIAKTLTERATAPLLRIGADTFDRRTLSAVSCFNFAAAANLSKLLDDLHVKNTRDLFDRIPPSALAIPHLGAISLAVLGAAFEQKGIGGTSPLEAWVVKHRDAKHKDDHFVTFSTLKHQVEAAIKDTRRGKRKRA